MQHGPEPKLIESSLGSTIEQNGICLTINIVRIATHPGWSLEVVNKDGTSIVWDDPFQTYRAADAAFRKALAEEGQSHSSTINNRSNLVRPRPSSDGYSPDHKQTFTRGGQLHS